MDGEEGKAVAVLAHENAEESNEIERSKVGIMRAIVEREDPSAKVDAVVELVPKNDVFPNRNSPSQDQLSLRHGESRALFRKEVDDFMIRRFLRARDLDIEKASTLFLKYLNWKRSFVPNGYISPSEISNQLEDKKVCMQGLDKKGRPIVVAFGGKHYPSKGSVEDFKRLVVFTLDKICARMPRGQEKFLAIGDLQGWGYSNSDIRGYVASLSILQDCYPERLGKLFIVHSPYIFMTAWKVVYPFIDSNTKKKIVFVEKKKLKSTLLEDIDESQVPDVYGGKLPLVPIQDC